MSGNTDAVRTSMDAFNRGDIEGGLEHFDPEVVLRLDPSWPENSTRFGIDAVRAFFEDLVATLGPGDSSLEEVVELGGCVVARFKARFEGRASSLQDEIDFTQVLTFRSGKVILFEYYLDFDRALEAVGAERP